MGITPGIQFDGIATDALASCRPLNDVDEPPDVAQARENLDIAKRNLRNVWLRFLPTLGAQSTISSTGQPVFSSLGTTWNVQALLSVPIWDGGAPYGGLRATRAAEDIAAQNLVALRRQATVQVEHAGVRDRESRHAPRRRAVLNFLAKGTPHRAQARISTNQPSGGTARWMASASPSR
ncbi:MAG: TolC family protein [Myxococcales bacterium]|nr:TolC family protein [Myxococcales bacterium]